MQEVKLSLEAVPEKMQRIFGAKLKQVGYNAKEIFVVLDSDVTIDEERLLEKEFPLHVKKSKRQLSDAEEKYVKREGEWNFAKPS